MSPAKHTPGPWKIGATIGGRPKVINQNGFAICGFASGSYAQMQHDARLIAAAPELLEALQQQLHALNVGSHDAMEQAYEAARAAIAKATGEAA